MPVVTIGDVRLNYSEKGRGKPLLLVHGFPLDHTMWARQLDALSSSHRVIAPDLRGFGASSVTAGTVTMAQYADDLAGLLGALGIDEPVIFCGLSMGGYVAWQFALRHRPKLAKLILCDTRAVADSPEAAAGRQKTAEKVLADGASVVKPGTVPLLGTVTVASRGPLVTNHTTSARRDYASTRTFCGVTRGERRAILRLCVC